MRLTRFAKVLVVAVIATAAMSVLVPTAGLVMAVLLALLGLFVLAEGFIGTRAEAGHEAWAKVEAERKREALRRGWR